MRTRLSARRVRISTLLLVLAGALTACGGSSSGTSEQLTRSLRTMSDASGYTFDATLVAGSNAVTVSGDFQAPNRIQQAVTKTGTDAVTMVLDGGTVYVKSPTTGTWSSQAATSNTSVDLRSTFGALSDPQGLSVNGDTSTFTLTESAAKELAGPDATGTATVTATAGPVGLTQLRYVASLKGQLVTVTINYSNVNAAPAVTVPI